MAPAPDFYGASPRIVHVDLRKLYAPLWKVKQTAQEVDKGDVSRSNAHPLHLKALGGGRYYVIDGNHRVLEALLAGRKTLPARVGYPGPLPGGASDLARHADAVVETGRVAKAGRASKAGRSSGTGRSITPAKTVAINLLVDDPAESFDSLRVRLRNSQSVYDQVSRTFVPSGEVLRALNDLEPRAYSPTARLITVYHATSNEAARELLLRGFLPETKPRPRGDYEYAPGRGIDAGLYVGATPEAVRGYGRVVLAVQVPLKLLSVPTEQRQLGVTDAREALAGHDGAVVHDRIPAEAFKRV